MRRLSILTLVIGTASSLFAGLPGGTLTNGNDPTLQKDVLADMSVTEKALFSSCKNWRVIQTAVSKPPASIGKEKGTGLLWAQWTERWTVEHCGKKSIYTIRFDARGSQGSFFKFDAPH
jgi:hypothetical protein